MLIFCLNSGSFGDVLVRCTVRVEMAKWTAAQRPDTLMLFINQTSYLPAFCAVEAMKSADVVWPHHCQHPSTQIGPSSRCSKRHWSWGLGRWLVSRPLLGIGRTLAGATQMGREQVRWRTRETQKQDNMATYQHRRFHVINYTKDALMNAVSTLILRHNTEKQVDPGPQLLMLLR